MSDSSFKTAPFAAYTNKQLNDAMDIIVDCATATDAEKALAGRMEHELCRRVKVAAGDVSIMTDGERLRYYKRGGK